VGLPVHGVTLGEVADPLAEEAAGYGAKRVYQVHHELLLDYGPEAWGEALAQLARSLNASVVVGMGTDRGNEVLAQAAARLAQPLVTNCLEVHPGEDSWEVLRMRWGGSLWERASVGASVKLLSLAPNQVQATVERVEGALEVVVPELAPELARTVVRRRVTLSEGRSLGTAPVVVSGGRGVKSAEGFAPLEELAGLLGGAVGCSRVATNNGWRPHSDQVGQTGTRIAPEIYIACGISGAIQHWVGAMGSKRILAINTDPEANMVQKADYAVIGDLHEVVPAIVEAVRTANG
jgi:electron transfer flavoprotein alpha subunit